MHLEIWSIAGVLSVDHVQPSVFGVSGFGRVHVDAEDEGQLFRDDLGVGGTQLRRYSLVRSRYEPDKSISNIIRYNR